MGVEVLRKLIDGVWRTVVADAGGNGGSQPFLVASVTLTDAQIRRLPSQAVEIVASPGANKLLVPINAFALLDATAGAYNGDASRSWQLMSGPAERSGLVQPDSILAGAAAHFFLFPPLSFIGAGDFTGYLTAGQGQISSDVIDGALEIADVFNGVADYTGGHISNTLKVTVTYIVADA